MLMGRVKPGSFAQIVTRRPCAGCWLVKRPDAQPLTNPEATPIRPANDTDVVHLTPSWQCDGSVDHLKTKRSVTRVSGNNLFLGRQILVT